MYSIAISRHALTHSLKGQGHMVMETAQLLVTVQYSVHLCYLRPLPAWVCKSIRLLCFLVLSVFLAIFPCVSRF